MLGLIIGVIIVLSVVAHYFMWRSSKREYAEYMERLNALNEKLKRLDEGDHEMDKMIDEVEDKMNKINDGIDDLRFIWFTKKENTIFEN